MPGVITDVRSGRLDGADGTYLDWEAEGFTPVGTSERIRERTVAKFPTSLLAVRIADVDKIDERNLVGRISKKKYKVSTFIPEPSEEERIDIGLRFEEIRELAEEQGLLANED